MDRIFIQKFNKVNFIYILLNTRKIYVNNEKIKENSRLNPKKYYEKNKLKTEIFLKKRIKNKFLSLRISNIIGYRLIKTKRNNHKLFFDNFLIMRKKE